MQQVAQAEDGGSSSPPPGYAVILTTSVQDTQRHAVYSHELAIAFRSMGFSSLTLDYQQDVRQVSTALADPACRFFVCFNGFGSELLLATPDDGRLASAFDLYGKLLFDLATECPAHESMRHQASATGSARHLMVMDPGHAHLARLAGMMSVRTVPGMAFPGALSDTPPSLDDRPIDILLPLSNCDPARERARHSAANGHRSQVFKTIFESVTSHALSDLGIDAWTEALVACQEIGIVCDPRHPDVRFLLSSIVDHVSAHRQRMLVHALQHLPVTITADTMPEPGLVPPGVKFVKSQGLADLTRTMADAKLVVCTPRPGSGGRDAALAAFTAGALVSSGPDDLLEAALTDGDEMLVYRDFDALARELERTLAAPGTMQNIAKRGRAKALESFSPVRLARRMLARATSSF